MGKTETKRVDQIRGMAQQAFLRANPDIWNKIQERPVKIQEVKDIRDRVQAIKQRMQDHSKRHRQNWVGREAVRLLEEHGHKVLEYPRPSWIADLPVNFTFIEEARRRVQSRTQSRMSRITEAGKRMEARILGPHQVQFKDPTMKKEIDEIIAKTGKVRNKARAHYAKNRNRWLESVAARGSNNPKMEVFRRQQKRMERIDRGGEERIRQKFMDHGRTLPKRQEQTFTQDFNQVMG